MMNENQKKLQMNRGLTMGLALLIVTAIVITVVAVVSAKRAKPTPGSNAFVPAVAGLILAGEVIRDLTGHQR